jgi:hypothetical protein
MSGVKYFFGGASLVNSTAKGICITGTPTLVLLVGFLLDTRFGWCSLVDEELPDPIAILGPHKTVWAPQLRPNYKDHKLLFSTPAMSVLRRSI